MKKLVFLFFFFSIHSLFSQQADKFLKLKNFRVGDLSKDLKESSALITLNGKIFSLNDSGNQPEIFEINPENAQTEKVLTTDAANVDWESLATDGSNLFVGDFGNNCGCRKDLSIYKLSFSSNKNLQVSKTIDFYYPEQEKFEREENYNNFDGEAMLFLNGKLHIFTKEWKNKATTHYLLDPEINGSQPAKKVEVFDTGFLVTDASFFKNTLYLLGYTKKGEVFLDVFEKIENGKFFTTKPLKIYLGSALTIGQTEGVTVNENGIYISSEKFKSPLGTVNQSFYFIPKEKLSALKKSF